MKNKKMIVNDPIHQVMHFHGSKREQQVLKQVIDSREFQRLRRISQLGLASYVFPGATHSRFCHSLGTSYISSQIIDHLKVVCSEEEINSKQRFEVILSALLHDVGHGPFSHSFERVLKDFKDKNGNKFKIMHEAWSSGFINSKSSGLRKILYSNGIDLDALSAPLVKNEDDVKSKGMALFLKQIVSSQLDADRMDYLRRDAHFSGVSMGGFDLGYLINSLTIIEHSDKSKTLGITHKGVRTYESFALARQLMNLSIYYHPKVKVLEYMMEKMIRLMIKNKPKLFKYHVYPKYFSQLHEALFVDKEAVEEKSFISKNLNSYLELTDDSVYTLLNFLVNKNIGGELADLGRRIINRDIYEHYNIVEGKGSLIEKCLQDYNYEKGVDFEVIKLNSEIYDEKKDNVFVQRSDFRIDSIGAQSKIISIFSNRSEGDEILVFMNSDKKEVNNMKIIIKQFNNCVLFTGGKAA